jgi:hypothetical protein
MVVIFFSVSVRAGSGTQRKSFYSGTLLMLPFALARQACWVFVGALAEATF